MRWPLLGFAIAACLAFTGCRSTPPPDYAYATTTALPKVAPPLPAATPAAQPLPSYPSTRSTAAPVWALPVPPAQAPVAPTQAVPLRSVPSVLPPERVQTPTVNAATLALPMVLPGAPAPMSQQPMVAPSRVQPVTMAQSAPMAAVVAPQRAQAVPVADERWQLLRTSASSVGEARDFAQRLGLATTPIPLALREPLARYLDSVPTAMLADVAPAPTIVRAVPVVRPPAPAPAPAPAPEPVPVAAPTSSAATPVVAPAPTLVSIAPQPVLQMIAPAPAAVSAPTPAATTSPGGPPALTTISAK